MRRTQLMWTLALVATAAAPLAAGTPQSLPPSHLPVVVTVGEATVRAVPDRAFVVATAESRAREPREAQRQNAEVMTAVQQALRAAQIAADAVRTLGVELHPEFDYVNGRRVLRGYVARNRIEVRVDEIERVGEILDLTVRAGATTVGDVRFDIRDRAALEREALRQAVADARSRADAAAEGVGRTVDRILRIEEQRAAVTPIRPMLAQRMEVADVETPVSPGEIEVRAHVVLTMAIR